MAFDGLIANVLPCSCGLKPLLRHHRVNEDTIAIWAECDCGKKGESVEDAMLFVGMAEDAIDAWNRQQGQRAH